MLPPLEIESAGNAKVKAVARLRDKRGRSQAGQYLIDGLREVTRAIESGAQVETLICCPAILQSSQLKQFHELASQDGGICSVWHLSTQAFDKIAYGQRAEGIIAVAASTSSSLSDLHLPENPLVVVVEGIEKPGNLGAVFRTADSVGADAVVLADSKVDTENPNAIRASLGTIFAVPHAAAATESVINWLKEKGIQPVAARVDGARYYHEIDYCGPTAIVLGSEAFGLTQQWSGDLVQPVKIPMKGIADSLNLSVSAAVILYEAGRQRGFA